mmetsp:Transcript_17719/g.24999  ORF Transcript_17719/g.24999 Transcript_17719/m.24999 type:complete len:404 (+) Transcript_17719:81-1292(+)
MTSRIPSCEIYDWVIDRNWDGIVKYLKEDPEGHAVDASYFDPDCNETPLYAACQSDPSLEVIEALIDAYPDAAHIPQTKNKDLPLHVACRYRCSIQVILALLQAPCNEELNNSFTSSSANIDNQYNMVLAGSKWGKTPMMALCDGYKHIILGVDGEDLIPSISMRETYAGSTQMLELWQKIEILLYFASPKHSNGNIHDQQNCRDIVNHPIDHSRSLLLNHVALDSSWLPVHAAASIGLRNCPIYAFRIVMLHSSQPIPSHLQASTKDVIQDGRLALHHLVSAPVSLKKIHHSREAHGETVRIILKCHPMAASTPDPKKGCGGRLPLHAAVAAGRGWEGGVKDLIHAYPRALRIPDPITGLFPFMLACCCDKNEIRCHKSNLNDIFQILIALPDVMHCLIRSK